VTAKDVVNVLGRWQSHAEWDAVGKLAEMNTLFDADGDVQDGPALAAAWQRWDVAHEGNLWASTITKDRTVNLPPWKARNREFDPYWGAPDVEAPGSQPWAARSPECPNRIERVPLQ